MIRIGLKTKIALYVLYSIFCTVFFLYILFPSDLAVQYIQRTVRNISSDIDTDISSFKVRFPLNIEIKDCVLMYRSQPAMSFDSLQADISIINLFRGVISFKFECFSKAGVLEGKGSLDADKNISLHSNIKALQLKEIEGLKSIIKRDISGLVSGRAEIEKKDRRPISLTADIKISALDAQLYQPVMGISKVVFDKIDAQISIKNSVLSIEKAIAEGSQADGDFNGQVALKKAIGKSQLNIAGSIIPRPEFLSQITSSFDVSILDKIGKVGKKKFTIMLQGTVESPEISWHL